MRRAGIGAVLAAAVLTSPLHAVQDDELDFDFDDELDALLSGELIDEGGPATGLVRGIQGFGEVAARGYFRDRDEGQKDEQLVLSGELELDLRFADTVTGYFRPRFLVDALDGDYQRFEPFEGYVTWEAESWDLRAGSFVENWGVVDTFNPVDVLNRRDFGSDLLDADRLGEVGFRARRSFTGTERFGEPTVSLYALPVWRPTRFAPEDQRFAIAAGSLTFDEDAGLEPEGDERLFLGARVQSTWNTSLFNADVQAVAADGPSRFPALQVVGGELVPVYHTATILGAGIRAVPNEEGTNAALAKYTLKAELAHTRNDELDDVAFEAPDDFTAWVVGVDRVFDNALADQDSLTATLEYAREAGASDAQSAFRPFRNDLIARAFWERNDFDRTSVEVRSLFDLDNDEWIGELLFETQLRSWHEDLQLGLQLQVFDPAGSDESLFGLFPNNTSLLVRLRFDF